MLATQLNHLVHSKHIIDNSIIKLKEFMSNIIKDKIVVIILGLDVVTTNPEHKIGNPVDAGSGIRKTSLDINTTQAIKPMYNVSRIETQDKNTTHQQGKMHNPSTFSANISSNVGSNPYGTYIPSYSHMSGASSSNSVSCQPITQIAALNLYQNRWTIKARVTNKGDVRSWTNSKGEGTLFSVTLLDSSAVDIRATFFKEAVDVFYSMLEEDKVYTFSGGRLKTANMQYNTCKSGFEITFDQNSEIHLDNDTGEIQQQIYEFSNIASLENVDPGSIVDILAVVKEVGSLGTIVSKSSGNEMIKTELTLVDDSGAEVACTVWGERAHKAQKEYLGYPIVALRRVKVSDFGGRTLSATVQSGIVRNPRVPELNKLRMWWNSVANSRAISSRSLTLKGGSGSRNTPFEDRKTISAIKNENLGTNTEKPDWISFKGTFNFIKSDREGGAWYTACANSEEPCKNLYKVTQTTDGHWHCERCNQTRPDCVRRFIFSATVADDTSTSWISLFDEQATILLGGVSATEIHREFNGDSSGGMDLYNSHFTRATFTDWIFTCKVKQDMNQDEVRLKTSVYSLYPLDYAKEGRLLLNAILKM